MNGRARAVAAMLLLTVFAVGALSGMALEEALGIDWFEFLDEDTDEAEDSLLVGLDLSREQRGRAEEILERQEERLEEYWQGRVPEIQGILQESYAEIGAVLTPEQRAVFDERVRNLRGRVPVEARDRPSSPEPK
jgi:Spy/CpxP family protein refolding chaperone